MNVTLKDRKTGKTQSVDINLGVLHVVARGNVHLSGAEVRRRLMAGEMFQTAQSQIFCAEAVLRAS